MCLDTETLQPGIKILRLARPEKLNALNERMRTELLEAIGAVDQPVVIIRGAEQTFCSGEDLDEIAAGKENVSEETVSVLEAIRRAEFVTVALIEGYAMGAGLFLAATCDIRIGVRGATLGAPVVEMNVPPQGDSSIITYGIERLTDVIGANHAKHLLLSASQIDAQRAYEIGLLEEVVDMPDEGIDFAADIADKNEEATRRLLQHIDSCANGT